MRQVISGGQTGADIAGIEAARTCGIKTGGFMPRGFKTLDGNKPEYAKLYGMRQTVSSSYPDRTRLNVFNSDGTIRFASNFNSPGEKLTLRLIKELQKPHYDINIVELIKSPDTYISSLHQWFIDANIHILNVAGNSEKTSPGIYDVVFNFLVNVFK